MFDDNTIENQISKQFKGFIFGMTTYIYGNISR